MFEKVPGGVSDVGKRREHRAGPTSQRLPLAAQNRGELHYACVAGETVRRIRPGRPS